MYISIQHFANHQTHVSFVDSKSCVNGYGEFFKITIGLEYYTQLVIMTSLQAQTIVRYF